MNHINENKINKHCNTYNICYYLVNIIDEFLSLDEFKFVKSLGY